MMLIFKIKLYSFNKCYTFSFLPAATKLWPRLFLHVSVILYTGGSLENPPGTRQTPSPPGRENPPGTRQTPPWDQGEPPGQGEPPQDQADTPRDQGEPPRQGDPPGTRQTPPQAGRTPPRTRQTPPGTKENPPRPGRPPQDQADTPPRGRRLLQHTVNERPVRILLECILVFIEFNET